MHIISVTYLICTMRAASGGKDKDEDEEDSDVEEEAADEADEDDSDLDLAWKMLDVARAIVEKHSGDTMEKVDILSALAEVALERGMLFAYKFELRFLYVLLDEYVLHISC